MGGDFHVTGYAGSTLLATAFELMRREGARKGLVKSGDVIEIECLRRLLSEAAVIHLLRRF